MATHLKYAMTLIKKVQNYDGKSTCAKTTKMMMEKIMMENAPAQKNEKLMKKMQNDDGMAIY